MAKKSRQQKKSAGSKRKRAGKKVVAKVAKTAAVIGGAVAKAVKNFAVNLGAMKIDKVAAADQMEELGELLEEVAKAKGVADEKAEAAKTAKSTYESKVNLFMEKVRGFTHPKSLPLFDAAQRETDQRSMLDAGGKVSEAVTETPADSTGTEG
jgi:hypothetical protein